MTKAIAHLYFECAAIRRYYNVLNISMFYTYADDTQLYLSFSPDGTTV